LNKIILVIPGEPQGKQRPRWSKHGTYTPKVTVNYETYIKELFAISYPGFKPIETAITITIGIFMGIPKSASQKKRGMMLSGQIRPIKRIDADNCAKVILDALASLAFRNDSQVVSLRADKWYSERPEVKIEITEEVEEEIKVGGTD